MAWKQPKIVDFYIITWIKYLWLTTELFFLTETDIKIKLIDSYKDEMNGMNEKWNNIQKNEVGLWKVLWNENLETGRSEKNVKYPDFVLGRTARQDLGTAALNNM